MAVMAAVFKYTILAKDMTRPPEITKGIQPLED
jgi:hypothetical protein